MQHSIYEITDVRVLGSYSLEITFSDGVKKVVDLERMLHGEMYGPLRDISLFQQVAVDPEVHTIIWPNGADFDPALLRDWENHKDEIEQRARMWQVDSDVALSRK